MNTHITFLLPQPFSAINPTFASKTAYLEFVREWQTVYRYLSLSLRTARQRSRLRPNNRPAKRALIEHDLALLAVRIAAQSPRPYVDNGITYGSHHVPLNAQAATWLLELRAAAKLDAARRYRAEAEAKNGPQA